MEIIKEEHNMFIIQATGCRMGSLILDNLSFLFCSVQLVAAFLSTGLLVSPISEVILRR
jgi:hypothetical protein